jgi:hypothetical protein
MSSITITPIISSSATALEPSAQNLRAIQLASAGYREAREEKIIRTGNTAEYRARIAKHMRDLACFSNTIWPYADAAAKGNSNWYEIFKFAAYGPTGDPNVFWAGLADPKDPTTPAAITPTGAVRLATLVLGKKQKKTGTITFADLPNQQALPWHLKNLSILHSTKDGYPVEEVLALDDNGYPLIPVLDKDGHPLQTRVLTTQGNPLLVPVLDAEGNPTRDADGNLVTTPLMRPIMRPIMELADGALRLIMDPRTDDDGNPILNAEGKPTMKPRVDGRVSRPFDQDNYSITTYFNKDDRFWSVRLQWNDRPPRGSKKDGGRGNGGNGGNGKRDGGRGNGKRDGGRPQQSGKAEASTKPPVPSGPTMTLDEYNASRPTWNPQSGSGAARRPPPN